ncbi:glycosyltransferase family 2 protein [Pelatocladus sp. BLCC-F211]|uniref:glycosyltransferase family 2 protein n=1 Tax=Pelatocladus sp. BLCC-F211 TaxID=3342752 RepID=UPI0035B8A5A4
MSDFRLRTPVAFIIFKRPHTTERVFEAIRQAKPAKLFVIADGPRKNRADEPEKCEATRAIINRVDWECEVFKNYSDTNLGCAERLPSGLDWVFNQVEEAIILEDDCLPHPTFFQFCEALLERYRYDQRIGTIIGQNVQLGRRRTDYSYYFSIYNRCWGWATWRRAWQNFDFDMKLWPEIKESQFLDDILIDSKSVKFWQQIFQDTYDRRINTVWDYQWTFNCWLENQLSIVPNQNLISNIGFGENATHTKHTKGSFVNTYANMPTETISFPLKHPPYIIRDLKSDRFMQKTFFNYGNLLTTIKTLIKKKIMKEN